MICPSVPGNCGKEGKKFKNFEYLKVEETFLDETKNVFYSF